jgi:hypothetical protein
VRSGRGFRFALAPCVALCTRLHTRALLLHLGFFFLEIASSRLHLARLSQRRHIALVPCCATNSRPSPAPPFCKSQLRGRKALTAREKARRWGSRDC